MSIPDEILTIVAALAPEPGEALVGAAYRIRDEVTRLRAENAYLRGVAGSLLANDPRYCDMCEHPYQVPTGEKGHGECPYCALEDLREEMSPPAWGGRS